MSTQVAMCATCGKGGDNLKVCTSCEQVSYCNAKCRKAHRPKHKKECRKLAAERHNEETAISSNIDVDAIIEKFSKIEISDDELFADPPPKEDCEICFLPMPCDTRAGGFSAVYQTCCGKRLCYGCVIAANNEMEKGTMKPYCPFCRVHLPSTTDERIQRVKKRMELNDVGAFHKLAVWYFHGDNGLSQDHRKAFELFNRGAELGSVASHSLLAKMYYTGEGVERNEEKSDHHMMLAAIKGSEIARHMLGVIELSKRNMDQAMKHYMIAAKSGWDDAMLAVGKGYKDGHVTKEDYAKTMRAHKQSTEEMKSEQREIAAVMRG